MDHHTTSGPPSGEGPNGAFPTRQNDHFETSAQLACAKQTQRVQKGVSQEVPLRGSEGPNEVSHLLKGVYQGYHLIPYLICLHPGPNPPKGSKVGTMLWFGFGCLQLFRAERSLPPQTHLRPPLRGIWYHERVSHLLKGVQRV